MLPSTTTQLCLAALALLLHPSSAQDTNTLTISLDGSCGGTTSQTCLGSSFGDCCSGRGYCGGSADYCNAECQIAFGSCTANASSISVDGKCGATDPLGQICVGSEFGGCCSETGWCGSTDVYCGVGCQGEFGDCVSEGNVNGTSTSATGVPASTGTGTGVATSTGASNGTSATSGVPSSTYAPVVVAATSSSMSTGAKAGVGVGVAVAAIAVIGAIFFFLRRRRAKKQTQGPEETVDEKAAAGSGMSTHKRDISSGTSNGASDNAYVNGKDLPPPPMPVELGNQGDRERAELPLSPDAHGSAVELASPPPSYSGKSGSAGVFEMPAGRD